MNDAHRAALAALLAHLKAEIPFYAGIDTGAGAPEDALRALPVVSKRELKESPSAFMAASLARAHGPQLAAIFRDRPDFRRERVESFGAFGSLYFESTSGSTGVPLIFFKSAAERVALGRAIARRRHAFDTGFTHKSMFLFVHADRSNHRFPPELAGDEREARLGRLRWLTARAYAWWHGNIHFVRDILPLVPDLGSGAPMPRFFENNGVALDPRDHAAIERSLGCRVLDHYGCREMWCLAYSRTSDGRLAVNEDTVHLEIVGDDGRPVATGEFGNVVVTSLVLRLMPFVRYNTGDLGRIVVDDTGARYLELARGRQAERIAGREDMFGNEIFSSIIWSTNGHAGLTFERIEVVQEAPRRFAVLVFGLQGSEQALRERFLERAHALLGQGDEFSFDFAPRTDGDRGYKPRVFRVAMPRNA